LNDAAVSSQNETAHGGSEEPERRMPAHAERKLGGKAEAMPHE